MGKLTDVLKKATEERLERIDKLAKIKEREQIVIKKIGNSKVNPSIVSYFDPKALITEQFKVLRTNILAINKTKPPKVLVVTSSVHTEGKTVSALNLAVTLSQSTHKPRVLLIDGDLRRGKMAKYLGVEVKQGLSDVLLGKLQPENAMFNIDIENLTFIAAGSVPENPAELLGSQKMRKFLSDVKTQFDHIIIDTPPIIAVADSGIVGAQSDGVLLVVQAGRTQRGIVKRATELLYQTHSKILGHILTNIEYHLPEYIYRYL